MKPCVLSVLGIFALVGALASTSAETIGVAPAIGWQGTSARHIVFDPYLTVLAVDENLDVANSESHVSFEDSDIKVWGGVDFYPWQVHGYLEVGDQLTAGTLHQVGGMFRDELYVATSSGDPVVVDFDFDLHVAFYDFDTTAGSSVANLSINLAYYPEGSSSIPNGTQRVLDNFRLDMVPHEQLGEEGEPNWFSYEAVAEVWSEGTQDYLSLEDVSEFYSFEDTVRLAVDGQQAGRQVASGTWLPVTMVLWGAAYNATVDWSNTLSLAQVQVYDAASGMLLDPSQYTLVSRNELFPSNGSIPEPAAGVLLALGLLVVGARIRWAR